MELTLLPFPYEFVKKPDFVIKDEVIKERRNDVVRERTIRTYWLIWLRWELLVSREIKA